MQCSLCGIVGESRTPWRLSLLPLISRCTSRTLSILAVTLRYELIFHLCQTARKWRSKHTWTAIEDIGNETNYTTQK